MAIAIALRKNNINIASVRTSDPMLGGILGSSSSTPGESPDHRQSDE
jgi:hypothetical protein